MKIPLCFITLALAIASSLNAKDLFIEETKKSDVFIFQEVGANSFQPLGTGFLVGVHAKPAEDRYYMYLVTAKHVVTDDGGKFRMNLVVRLNKKETGSEFFNLQTTISGQPAVFTHQSALVDLAVMPVAMDSTKFDVKLLQDDLLLTRDMLKELEIGEGTDVFFTGLFLPFFGQGRNYPIVRSGKVALLSDEKIPWRTDPAKPVEMRELFLLETQSFGGNSGSPVFVVAQKTPPLGQKNLRLMGVMMGTFQQGSPIAVVENSATAISQQNLGIAAVIPSYLLREILFGEALVKMRADFEAVQPPGAH
jgi:hypothetical protein